MLRNIVLLSLAGCTLINATPFKDHGPPSPPPFLPHGWGPNLGDGWGWGERPAYDINPHFGFRQYSEMRYEPLTAPYMYSTQLSGAPAPPQPLAPILKGEGPPYSPYLPGPVGPPMGPPMGSPQYMGGGNSILFDDGYAT